jgi:hypothetical protein
MRREVARLARGLRRGVIAAPVLAHNLEVFRQSVGRPVHGGYGVFGFGCASLPLRMPSTRFSTSITLVRYSSSLPLSVVLTHLERSWVRSKAELIRQQLCTA